jgi:pyroglutamyl-peptidase
MMRGAGGHVGAPLRKSNDWRNFMKILITGFEPFGESRVNPSERLVNALAGRSFPGVELTTRILPVDSARAPRALLAALEDAQPEAVICLGEAARRAGISIERVAVNLLDFSIPDNSGQKYQDAPIFADGPAAYFASLPVRRLHMALQQAGIPAELSLSAGAYLCNQVLYSLLHHLHASGQSGVPAGFLHLPLLPEQAALLPGLPAASMTVETSLAAMEIVLRELDNG